MYATSTEFKTLIRQSHKVITKAQIWQGDNLLLDIEPEEGQVDDDSRRAVRRTCSLKLFSSPTATTLPIFENYGQLAARLTTYTTLAASAGNYGSLAQVVGETVVTSDDGVIPSNAFDPLTPFGNELRLWRGIRVTTETSFTYASISGNYADYSALAGVATYGVLSQGEQDVVSDELVPLGVFVITNIEMEQTDSGVRINVTGQDRSLRISRNRWTGPYRIAQDTNIVTAIQELLQDRWTEVATAFSAASDTLNRQVLGTDTDNDPWADAQKLAAACGLELYFDGNGVAVLEPSPVYDDATADATYIENNEAMVLNVSRALSVESTYNGVIVTGESSSEDSVVIRSEAWDEDPASPTYRYGPFGQVPRFASTPSLKSQATADKMASALLAKSKGAQESIAWTQITDPSLEAGDVIALKNSATKVDRLLVLDRLTVPLNPSQPMRAVARTIRTLSETEAANAA